MIPIIEKIKENNKRKLEHRINTFISLTGYTKIETFNSIISDYLAVHKFIDNRNQIKFLSGYEFNNDSSLRDSIILNYNNYPTENKLAILKRFSSYDFSELLEKDFKEVFDKLNFCKGPSLGTEFTLLMPYTYLAHYDLIMSKDGNKFLEKIGLPINLLRVSVGCENINDIINEFERINN